MKFRVADTTYDGTAVSRLTLRQLLILEQETATLGRRITVGDVQCMSAALSECATDAERSAHPDMMWLVAVTVWAGRVAAGETLTFGEAIDVPMADVEFLPEEVAVNPTRPPVSAEAAEHRVGDLARIYDSPYTAV